MSAQSPQVPPQQNPAIDRRIAAVLIAVLAVVAWLNFAQRRDPAWRASPKVIDLVRMKTLKVPVLRGYAAIDRPHGSLFRSLADRSAAMEAYEDVAAGTDAPGRHPESIVVCEKPRLSDGFYEVRCLSRASYRTRFTIRYKTDPQSVVQGADMVWMAEMSYPYTPEQLEDRDRKEVSR